MTDDSPSPKALLEAIVGRHLASWLFPRMTLWPATESKPRGVRVLRDAMLETNRRLESKAKFRRYVIVGILGGIGAYTAITWAWNLGALASLGPSGLAWLAVLWLSLHEKVGP